MGLKCLRFLSLLCATLAMGDRYAHDLEIPGQDQLSGAVWLTIQTTFYGGFALVGGVTEVLGLLSTGLLAFHDGLLLCNFDGSFRETSKQHPNRGRARLKLSDWYRFSLTTAGLAGV